jgi:hypothetical protein
LANGRYDLQIHLTFGNLGRASRSASSETNLTRRVTLRGGETPISLRPRPPRETQPREIP